MKIRIDLKILIFLIIFFILKNVKIYIEVMFFAFIHEVVHILVGYLLRFKTTSIEIMPWGYWCYMQPSIKDYNTKIGKSNMIEVKKIIIAMAGPIINLLLAILFEKSDFTQLAYTNLAIFLFNLILIYPLDGGRVIQSILRILLGRKKAEYITNIIINMCIIILTIIGSILILYIKNISILLILIYLWGLVIRENKKYELKYGNTKK